uniref:Uncharacterized protein n=1 Tax=Arion vulgaris TaxID=1028688 RepID=A0A0B7ASB3_9EUPU
MEHVFKSSIRKIRKNTTKSFSIREALMEDMKQKSRRKHEWQKLHSTISEICNAMSLEVLSLIRT